MYTLISYVHQRPKQKRPFQRAYHTTCDSLLDSGFSEAHLKVS